MEILILTISLLIVIGVMSFFILELFKKIDKRDQIIFSMVKQNYVTDPAVVGDMNFDTLANKDLEEDKDRDDLVDVSEMTVDDLSALNK